jgi:hypothetical protein
VRIRDLSPTIGFAGRTLWNITPTDKVCDQTLPVSKTNYAAARLYERTISAIALRSAYKQTPHYRITSADQWNRFAAR